MSYGPPPPPYGDQPYGYQPYGGPPPQKPTNWLPWAIFSTLCCCLPLGIPSIVFAAQANSKWGAGDHAGAAASAGRAKLFFILAVVLGLLANGIYLAVMLRSGELSTGS